MYLSVLCKFSFCSQKHIKYIHAYTVHVLRPLYSNWTLRRLVAINFLFNLSNSLSLLLTHSLPDRWCFFFTIVIIFFVFCLFEIHCIHKRKREQSITCKKLLNSLLVHIVYMYMLCGGQSIQFYFIKYKQIWLILIRR